LAGRILTWRSFSITQYLVLQMLCVWRNDATNMRIHRVADKSE
jgi:hypothetical protein